MTLKKSGNTFTVILSGAVSGTYSKYVGPCGGQAICSGSATFYASSPSVYYPANAQLKNVYYKKL